METKKKGRAARTKRQVKYPRIGAAAEALGVSRTHLWYVLEGVRKGRSRLAEDYWQQAKNAR